MNHVTRILQSIEHGDSKAAEELLPHVYGELRKLAAAKMAQEPTGQTLQPTALVHEAWPRLVGAADHQWKRPGHFFPAAAGAMKRILVLNARRQGRRKHGGELHRVDLSDLDVASTGSDDAVLAVNEALDQLAAHDP